MEITREAADGIREMIENIANQVQPRHPYFMKRSAMFALCDIGILVAEADKFLGNKVKNHLAYDPLFIETCQSLYDGMTKTQRKRIGHDCLKDFERLDKKRDFCFEGFDDIVKQFREACSPTRSEEGTRNGEIASIDLTA